MPSLLWSAPESRGPIPVDEENVRTTVTTVQADAPAAVQTDAPEWNETRVDGVTEGGLTPHQLASAVTPSTRYVPIASNATENLFAAINNQVSSSGTAAERERAGEWGHGTMRIVEGIEPTIRDGAAFGESYFAADNRPQFGSGDQMTPAQSADPVTTAGARATAQDAARDAVAVSQYALMYAARMTGTI